MKNLFWITLAIVFAFCSVELKAQEKPKPVKTEHNEEPVTRAKKLSDKLSKDLELTEAQSREMYKAFLDEFKKERLIQDGKDIEASLKKLADTTDSRIQSILGEIKYANYKTMRKEKRGK